MHFVETIIAYLRHAARSTRPHATMQASVSDVTLCHRGERSEQERCRGKGWWASGASSASERHDYG